MASDDDVHIVKRRAIVVGGLAALATPLGAKAQDPRKVHRIGVLWFTVPSVSAPFFEALLYGCRNWDTGRGGM